MCCWPRDRPVDPGQERESKTQTYTYLVTSVMTKETLQGKRERIVFSVNGTGAIQYSIWKKNELVCTPLVQHN